MLFGRLAYALFGSILSINLGLFYPTCNFYNCCLMSAGMLALYINLSLRDYCSGRLDLSNNLYYRVFSSGWRDYGATTLFFCGAFLGVRDVPTLYLDLLPFTTNYLLIYLSLSSTASCFSRASKKASRSCSQSWWQCCLCNLSYSAYLVAVYLFNSATFSSERAQSGKLNK